MVIIELPSDAGGGSLRACSLGSCRVRNPLSVLRDRGDLRICDVGLAATHTVAEALQTVTLVQGERRIPDALSLYIFGTEGTPPTDRLKQTLSGGVEVLLLEISDDRQFTFGDICLQQNFVSRNLVQPYRGALLSWYRKVCLSQPIDEVCVEDALTRMREEGFQPDETMADLLRGVRLEKQSGEQIANTLGQLMSKVDGNWVVVGSLTVPGEDGAIMHARRALNEKISRACDEWGARFYDPSQLIVDYGRAKVLDADGADINEYAEDFYPTVGETLVKLLRDRGSASKQTSACNARRGPPARSPLARHAREQLADEVNAALVGLHRRRRLEFDSTSSGLYAHYDNRLNSEAIINGRDRAAFALIDAYLPAYDAYGVLRAGVGELALLIAAGGRRVIAYEPNANRRSAIEAGAVHLESLGLIAPGAVSTVAALVPEGPLDGGVLGVGLDVAQVASETAAAPYLEKTRVFEALLIDLRLFIRLRKDIEEQIILSESLQSMGFNSRRDYPMEDLFWFRRF